MKTKVGLILGAAALAALAPAQAFQNGGFETGSVDPGTNFINLDTGSTAITGWTVTSGNVDYVGTVWNTSEGVRAVDLNGVSGGAISQTFDTTAGQQYSVLFDFAANPALNPKTVNMQVSAAGTSQIYSFTQTTETEQNMGWTEKTFNFTASGTSTTLTFASLDQGLTGPALDNVRVQAVPEPASIAALGLGFAALIRRRSQRRAEG